MAKQDQQYLFGDADFIFNALSSESTIIGEEMSKATALIERKKAELESLRDRKLTLDKALKITKRSLVDHKIKIKTKMQPISKGGSEKRV